MPVAFNRREMASLALRDLSEEVDIHAAECSAAIVEAEGEELEDGDGSAGSV